MADTPKNIASFYNLSELKVLSLPKPGTALVEFEGTTLIAKPCGEEQTFDGEASTVHRDYLRRMREDTLQGAFEINFGALSCWANRRVGPWQYSESECGCCGEECLPEEWRSPDWQRVAGQPFDRMLLREALQYLYEVGTGCDRYVQLGLIPVDHPSVPDTFALVMRCGEWSAIVMQGKPGNHVGSDPLESP